MIDKISQLQPTPSSALAVVSQVTAVSSDVTALSATVAAIKQPLNYTTAEQNTGLTYTGGQTVYQKTIVIGVGPKASTVSAAHGITGLQRIIEANCWGTDGTNHGPAPFSSLTSTLVIQMNLDGTNVYLTSTGNYSAYTFHITLKYLHS